MSVIKKIQYSVKGFWSEAPVGYTLVMVDHEEHRIEFENVQSAPMDVNAFLDVCLKDKDILQELLWAKQERAWENRHYGLRPMFVAERSGSSGCSYLTLVKSLAKHQWAADEFYLQQPIMEVHISMMGKFNEGLPDFTAGNLLAFLEFWDIEIPTSPSRAGRPSCFRYYRPRNRAVYIPKNQRE